MTYYVIEQRYSTGSSMVEAFTDNEIYLNLYIEEQQGRYEQEIHIIPIECPDDLSLEDAVDYINNHTDDDIQLGVGDYLDKFESRDGREIIIETDNRYTCHLESFDIFNFVINDVLGSMVGTKTLISALTPDIAEEINTELEFIFNNYIIPAVKFTATYAENDEYLKQLGYSEEDYIDSVLDEIKLFKYVGW